ncbi:hypothetical protein HG530_003838 [Fusarium avenaceum]|nr:hypothetical protein HG530_003838 [Fusarium avenaceum]
MFQKTSGGAKEKLIVDSRHLLVPELIDIEDIRVTVRFGIGLLEKGDPSFVLISILSKEKSLGAGLVSLAIDILIIFAIDLLQKISLHARGVPAWRLEIEFIVDDGVNPLAITAKHKTVNADLCVIGDADPL